MRLLIAVIGGVLLFGCGGQPSDRAPAIKAEYSADKITDSVYVIHGPLGMPSPENQGFMNNPGIVITTAGTVIIDPGASVQSGEMVMARVRELTDKPVVAVFNTHIHGDHWLGNQAVRAQYPDAKIYGHPRLIEAIANGEGESWVGLMETLTEGASKGTVVVAADHPVDHGDVLVIGDKTFRIIHNGQAHTLTDIMLKIEEDSIVFLGDNGLSGRAPRMDDGSFAGSIAACDLALAENATHYVPGHGQTDDAKIVEVFKNYLSTLYGVVQQGYDEGLPDYEIKPAAEQALGDFAGWNGFSEGLGKLVSLAYIEVEAASF